MVYRDPTEHREWRGRVSRLVREEVLPVIGEYEERSVLPVGVFRRMGEVGLFRAHVPKEQGGLGLGTLGYCIGSEEVAKAGAGLTHNGHYQLERMLLGHGTPSQRERYLENLLGGQYVGAMAISEPGAGSSFAGLAARVEESNGSFALSGEKSFINDAAEADVMGVLARTGDALTIALLPKGAPGFRIVKKLDPLGFRSSPAYNFEMRGCPVGPDDILGAPGQGLKLFFTAFNFSRLGNASAALGIGVAAVEKALAYAKGRQAGEHKIADFQGVRWMFAEASVQLEAARLLRDQAASLIDSGERAALESSQAKLFCVETCNQVVGKCIQIAGRFGCVRDSLFELYLRDARALGIAGGSLEVMKNNIAREIVGY